MLRRVGMSLLLSWICLNAYAQLPHPNDTLENGKKVAFNQFLGRFSVYTEIGGPALSQTLNIGYSLVKTPLVTLDYTIGGVRRAWHFLRPWKPHELDVYVLSSSASLFIGRRKSRFNLKAGYTFMFRPEWYEGNTKFPNCPGICGGPPQNLFTFSIGYTYQHQYGLFFGVHAYGLVQLNSERKRYHPAPYDDIFPFGSLTIGYRLPSRQLDRQWKERSLKRRVLRVEKKKHYAEIDVDAIFYDDEPLKTDSAELSEIEKELAKLKRRHERYLKQEQRQNGQSHVFAEGFGAAGHWSVNYSYTFPITKSQLVALDFRGGIGSDDLHLQIPIHAGIKVMKNYRGTGVFLGIQPTIDWESGSAGAIYFLEHNVEFHFAYGLTGGVAFYLFYDPAKYKHHEQFAPYGGFFLGYRLPKMKKD